MAAHAVAFIEGAQSNPGAKVLTTVKHFPGHGDTATDTHLGLATITPIASTCSAWACAVSSRHCQNGRGDERPYRRARLDAPDLPSTLSTPCSPSCCGLGFRGMVVTDALIWAALSAPTARRRYARSQPVDVLLMPADGSRRQRRRRRRAQPLTQKRLTKAHAGAGRQSRVGWIAARRSIWTPSPIRFTHPSHRTCPAGCRPLRNPGSQSRPCAHPRKPVFVLAENRYGLRGRAFTQEVARRSPQSQIISLDSSSPNAALRR